MHQEQLKQYWGEYLEATKNYPMSGLAHRVLRHVHGKHSVVDLGAGGLRDAEAFAKAGHSVVAVDSIPGYLNRERVKNPSIILRELDFARVSLPFAGHNLKWDVVFSNFTLGYLPDLKLLKETIARMCESVEKGGIIAFNLFGNRHQGDIDMPSLALSSEQIDDILFILAFYGLAGVSGEPVRAEYEFESDDWKGRKTNWHYHEFLMQKAK